MKFCFSYLNGHTHNQNMHDKNKKIILLSSHAIVYLHINLLFYFCLQINSSRHTDIKLLFFLRITLLQKSIILRNKMRKYS